MYAGGKENMEAKFAKVELEKVYADILQWINEPNGNIDYFSNYSKNFLESMLYVSKINIDSVQNNKNEIDKNIKSIKDFLQSKKSTNEGVKKMFGFTNEDLEFEHVNKHYYYYIADVKLKACIYLLRIHRFIIKFDNDMKKLKNRLELFREEIENIYVEYIANIMSTEKDNKKCKYYLLYLDEENKKIKTNEIKEELDERKNIENDNNEEKVTFEKLKSIKCEIYTDEDHIDKISKCINTIYRLYQKLSKKIDDEVAKDFNGQGCDLSDIQSAEVNESDDLSELFELASIIDSLIGINQISGDDSKDLQNKNVINFTSRIKEIKHWQKIFQKKTEWKKHMIDYYLFDNSMKEIYFTGIGWKYSWRWLEDHADLFRSVGTDDFQWTYKKLVHEQNFGKVYMENMFYNIVKHMNRGNDKPKLASYSKDPYRDIYKYLKIESLDNSQKLKINWKINIESKETDSTDKDNNKASLICSNNAVTILNDKTVLFAMIKQASVNIIRKLNKCMDGEKGMFTIKDLGLDSSVCKSYKSCGKSDENPPKSFYEFIDYIRQMQNDSVSLKEKNIDISEYAFSVDILNNGAVYSGDVRSVFQEYMDQWVDGYIPGIQRNIVSSTDEEVVVLGNVCDSIEIYEGKESKYYDECDSNIEYRINLNKQEMIYLYIMLNKTMTGKDEFTFKNIYSLVSQMKSVLDKNVELANQNTIDGKTYTPRIEINVNDISICMELEEKAFNFLKSQKNLENVMNDLLKKILDRFEKEQDDIVKNKINFILSFVKKHDLSEKSFKGEYRSGDIEVLFWKYMLLG